MSDAFHIRDNHASTELSATVDGTVIAGYVYRPDTPRVESPKPYFHPLRTLSGAPVGVFRPWDHRWHKGLQMTWSHISGQNFSGGPTFDRNAPGHGYVWRENNGSQLHRGFDRIDAGCADATVLERIEWVAFNGETWLAERRGLRFHSADPERGSGSPPAPSTAPSTTATRGFSSSCRTAAAGGRRRGHDLSAGIPRPRALPGRRVSPRRRRRAERRTRAGTPRPRADLRGRLL